MPFSDDEKCLFDLYWKMYSEHATQARQHETLRGTIATILVSVAAALISFHGNLVKPTASEHPNETVAAGIALIVLGVMGMLLSYKHYERNRHHTKILSKFRRAIDKTLSQHGVAETLTKIVKDGRGAHDKKYPISSKWLRAFFLWASVFFLIAVGGVAITLHGAGRL